MTSHAPSSRTWAQLALLAVPLAVAGLASRVLKGPSLLVCLLLAVAGFVIAAVLTLLVRRTNWPKNALATATAVYLVGALLLSTLNDAAMVGLAWTSVGAIAGALAFFRPAR
jgi:hypothetical protein